MGQPTLADRADSIREILSDLSLRDVLEVVANVLISEGMETVHVPPDTAVTPLTVFALTAEDIHEKGRTLGNSTVMLGIDLLTHLGKA